MKRLSFMLLLALLAASCGLNNTMYNANKYFKAAQARPLNANGKPNSQAVQDYTKTIQKCGKILSASKRPRNADDALYLMARALYYKGNSSFQAKDQFEALIQNFPESKHFGDAHIYLARVYREINRNDDARKVLEQFLYQPKQVKLHPRALLTLAEFEIADKDYVRAQYWLEKIITQYPKAQEYREAYLLFGQNYYIQKDYPASLREYEKIAESRLMPKQLKLEAQYWVALNQFQLGDYQQSWKNLQGLLKDEVRPEKVAQARVLQARLYFARGKDEEGVAESEDISKSYPRTQSSASAQYFLGEHYFRAASDLDKASAAYNKVRVEFAASEWVDAAQKKSAAITQLKQNSGLDPESNLQLFVDYHVSAAENYLNSFALPDSALLMYQRVIGFRDSLDDRLGRLAAELNVKQAAVDSLEYQLSLLPEPTQPDSIEQPDTLKSEPADPRPDSLAAPADSLDPRPAAADSLQSESVIPPSDKVSAPADSLITKLEEPAADPQELRRELQRQRGNVQNELDALQNRLSALEDLKHRYLSDVVPLALFSRASIYNKSPADSVRMQEILEQMRLEFPGDKYTNALSAMVAGESIRLIDPAEESEEALLDRAFGLAESEPDSMLVVLEDLTESDYSAIRLKSNFRLGWFHTFERPDTSRARPYLEEVLTLQTSGDYASLTTRFFNGDRFLLNTFAALVDSIAAADSLKLLEELMIEADSLNAGSDSLSVPGGGPEQTEEPRPENLEEGGTELPMDPEQPAIKEEHVLPPDPQTPPELPPVPEG